MTNNSEILTAGTVLAIAEILGAIGHRIALVNDDGDIVYGHARGITTGDGVAGFIGRGRDIRDGFLWVTTRNGFESWYPVRALIASYARDEFRRYDW
jgi:hypothetical protein